jgi:hypothetical protein
MCVTYLFGKDITFHIYNINNLLYLINKTIYLIINIINI